MRKNLPWLLMAILMSPHLSKAQSSDEKIPLAILPYVLSTGAQIGNPADVVTIQEIVTKDFTNQPRFTVLDRSRFDAIIKEMKIQSMEQFLDSKIVAQGKQLGAKYLVAGVVNEYKITRQTKDMFGKKFVSFPASLKMSFGVIVVETGQLLFTSPINVIVNDLNSMDSLNSGKRALTNMEDEVKKQMMNILTGSIQVLGIDKTGKDGLPATVLTSGGGVLREKVKLGVFVTEMYGNLKREKQIAELKTSKIEGDVVVCEVKSGARELDAAIKTKTPPMTVKILQK
ncbi:MAG: hypothetical protein J0H74_29760 [Chitinophagaceae bacterium]|nr:hypothetical protein [Chitinophagaceae bacterium]